MDIIVHDPKVKSIDITNLSASQIQKAKDRLIKGHAKSACSDLSYSISNSTMSMCQSRVYFVELDNHLYLCGLYHVNEKRDSIREHTAIRHETYDYVVYSQASGFLRINGCSEPDGPDVEINASPAIYFQKSVEEPFQLLKYGETYASSDLCHVLTKHNEKTYITNIDRIYHISIFVDDTIIHEEKYATKYAELPLESEYFVMSTQRDDNPWQFHSSVVSIHTKKIIPLIGYNFAYPYTSTLVDILIFFENTDLWTSANKHYCFYISKNDSFAFEAIQKCIKGYGSLIQLDNLFGFDSSVNYKIMIPKTTRKDLISFIYGVISKSRAVYPVILGCRIHDVIEVLRECSDRLPPHALDRISAENVIRLIREQYGNLDNWEIVYLLVKHYGPYSVSDQFHKYWMYFHGEGLRCEYLPVSMEDVIAETIDGDYVHRLEKLTINARWKSELLLYRLVYQYYPDAEFHYSAQWFGHQHLDIYIPSINLGIEYQGRQHYEAIDYFNGKIGLDDRKYLDERKRDICLRNGTILVEWPYTVPVLAANLICILKDCGIANIPVPDPFATPPEKTISESIPEEKVALSIRKYGIDGRLLQSFSSYKEASEHTGLSASTIHNASTGINRTAGGFQWRRLLVDDEYCDIPPLPPKSQEVENTAKAVYQMTSDGEIIGEYTSINNAEKKTGINRKSIRCALNGTQKSAGGYLWAYKGSSD